MVGQKTPERWEEYGSPSLDFCGAPGTYFFCGAFLRGILRGWAPQALVPQQAPQNEPSRQCWQQKRPIPWCQPCTATHLGDPEAAVGELGGVTSSPSSACIAFQDSRASAKLVPILVVVEESNICTSAQSLYLRILPFWCWGLVLNLEVFPTECSERGCGRQGHGDELIEANRSWNQRQTLVDCLCCHMYSAQRRSP